MYDPRIETMTTVAQVGSFNKAAAELGITPVSVMNQINSLEEHVGIKLFERTTQGIRLTKAGASFCEDAKRIIDESNAAIARARRIQKKEARVIRIGTSLLRPCQSLMKAVGGNEEISSRFQFRIMPFDDSPQSMEKKLSGLGDKLDCIVGPCDSPKWQEKYSIKRLEDRKCCCAVSRRTALAKKDSLGWEDLEGRKFLMVKRGESPVLDRIRDDIEKNHPSITIVDIPSFYDTSVFNICDELGAVMETLDIWEDIHPSLKLLPMDWPYTMPYGIIYSKNPSESFLSFLEQLDSLEN